jgi:hypothetical protein
VALLRCGQEGLEDAFVESEGGLYDRSTHVADCMLKLLIMQGNSHKPLAMFSQYTDRCKIFVGSSRSVYARKIFSMICLQKCFLQPNLEYLLSNILSPLYVYFHLKY